MPKIKTIPKSEMKKVKQRSPSLIDEMVLAIEELLTTNYQIHQKKIND